MLAGFRDFAIVIAVGTAIFWVGISAVSSAVHDKPLIQCILSNKLDCE